jgi:hypothetical protein
MNRNGFIGVDKDIKLSLEKYGVICRNERSDEYMCFFKVNDLHYDHNLICESELDDFLSLKSWIDTKTRKQYLEFCNQSLEDVKKLPFVHKLFSMIQFFGVQDIMGKTIDPLTLTEALDMMQES